MKISILPYTERCRIDSTDLWRGCYLDGGIEMGRLSKELKRRGRMVKNRFKLMLAVLIAFMILTGCGAKMIKESDMKNQGTDISMFVVLEVGSTYKIVYHQETKVMYAISTGGYNAGTFTVMLDADGKPLLHKGGD